MVLMKCLSVLLVDKQVFIKDASGTTHTSVKLNQSLYAENIKQEKNS